MKQERQESTTQSAQPQSETFSDAVDAASAQAQSNELLQLDGAGNGALTDANSMQIAQSGVSGQGGQLPFLDRIQASFGKHDVSAVSAHTDGRAVQASTALGANAYATGNAVAFGGAPDLHTAAHEAAHVVQQRKGVNLKGGFGRAGDAYEQHADAVADRVVAGQSAEDLLSASPGSGGETSAVQRDENNNQLEDTLNAVAESYSFICLKQRDAVADLSEDVQKTDPPPLWQQILMATGEIALTFALGGVGEIVANSVKSIAKNKGLRDAVGGIIAGAMKDAAKATAKKGFAAAVGSSASSDPRELFFRGQRDSLTDTAANQAIDFSSKEKQNVRNSADPQGTADALLAGVRTNFDTAYVKQRNETLDAWARYKAQGELGKHPEGGTDLSDQLGDTSGAGVLGLVIRAQHPGSKPTIERAEMEGLNEGLRNIIATRKIKDLKVPITVKGNVDPDIGFIRKYLGKENQPAIRLGRNSAGTVWRAQRGPGLRDGMLWLYYRAYPNPEFWGPEGRPLETLAARSFDGARLFFNEDLGNLTVGKDKLSG